MIFKRCWALGSVSPLQCFKDLRTNMLTRSLAFALLALAASVSGDKTAEEPLSFASIFENINTKFQNATHVVEGILGVDIPSTKQEVETALQENLNNLKDSAAKIQAKLAEYNVTGNSLSGILAQIQGQVNSTVEDLAQRNPDVGKLLEQVKTGYTNLADVGQKVQKVVEEQAGSASEDLKGLAQSAQTELSKAATQFEKRVQEVLATKDKTSGKA
ncbi:uncharacterized protein LOC128998725 [Macrosteles quadrilineatus]|uniref:uncharacterized protein LOC128998725 n=1 Tax=Macrosteles quadrilineatus TaxID=74068 RepID=UPI0023E11279|nr:uncharacterized protein LOC128998725 [Macrosteles quadrilineatus]